MPIPFLGPIITGLLGMGKDALKSRNDRIAATQQANAAWEASTGRSMENGWKDEYVTVVVTFPLWQIFIGNLLYAFTGRDAILKANAASLTQIGELMDTPYGQLMMVVVLAAVGIKGLKVLR